MAFDPYKLYTELQIQGGKTTSLLTSPSGVVWSETGTKTKIWDSDGGWVKFASSGSTDNLGGVRPQNAPASSDDHGPVQYVGSPTQFMSMKTGSDLTSIEYLMGLTSNISPTPDSTQDEAIFWYDTNTHSDGFWRTRTDNASGSPEIKATTTAFAASTAYNLKIDLSDSTKVTFYINDVLVTTHSSVLPSSGVYMTTCMTIKNRADASRFFYFGRSYIEFK